jgi:Tol biopolymer transport system component
MPLVAGTRLGPYEIISAIGKGGMGEVYRARDTKLNRDVAIKVLPDLFALDPERLARFTREAQTLAALNHPHIAAIYGIEDLPPQRGGQGSRALIMELVEGEDLSVHIARGPMALTDALPIAKQIADALEAAHEQGIVHRDLKPANIKVRGDGTVKVLDFGLAKALGPDGISATADAMHSPTFTSPAGMTRMGVIIGTAAYMAPEQARGRAVDRRADIWAFGVVLYEMLTGRPLFGGDNISDLLASVLKTDPDWTALPADTPASIRRLLRRCLEKDPRARLSSIGDARLELDEREADAPLPTGHAPNRGARIPSWAALLAGAALAALAGLAWWWLRPAPAEALARLSILPPAGQALYPDSTMVAISPNGRLIAFVTGNPTAPDTQLWVRPVDSMTATRLDDAQGARMPFWSPDGKRIGFFTTGKLKSIAAAGGRSEALSDAPSARGGAWTLSNTILFAPAATGPLFQIPATGGTASAITTLDTARKEFSHRFPSLLPDGRHFIYAALPAHDGQVDIFVGSLDGGAPKRIAAMETAPTFSSPDWLLYTRQGVLTAQKFDPAGLALNGDPVPLGDEPSRLLDTATSFTAGRAISISSTGTLAYFSAPSNETQAVWFDAAGRNVGRLDLPAGHYDAVSISPDGTRAVLVRSITASESALWLADLTRGGATPLTTAHGRSDGPVWSPDGTRVVFNTDRDGPDSIYIKTIGDASPEQPFYRSEVLFKGPVAWSPDGKWIVETELDPKTSQDVYILSATDPKQAIPFVRSPLSDSGGPISPDGRWLSYVSHETGRREIYVQSFPTPGHRVQISQAGARRGWWTPDGRGIVFVGNDGGTLWRVDVSGADSLHVGIPRQLGVLPPNMMGVDATPDRQRFLALVPTVSGAGSITVVQNWHKAIQ